MSPRWLIPLLALSLLALAATCGGDDDGLDGVELDSGIQGTVTIGPMCPVVQADSPCPDQPYQAHIVILDEDGDEVVSFESEEGTFTVNLSPGTYTLVPQSPNPGAPPFAPEQQVVVRRGEYTQVAVQYDSGIR